MAMYPPLWFEGVSIPEVDLYIPSKGRARVWTLGVLQSLDGNAYKLRLRQVLLSELRQTSCVEDLGVEVIYNAVVPSIYSFCQQYHRRILYPERPERACYDNVNAVYGRSLQGKVLGLTHYGIL
jgi:hypothetical protein